MKTKPPINISPSAIDFMVKSLAKSKRMFIARCGQDAWDAYVIRECYKKLTENQL